MDLSRPQKLRSCCHQQTSWLQWLSFCTLVNLQADAQRMLCSTPNFFWFRFRLQAQFALSKASFAKGKSERKRPCDFKTTRSYTADISSAEECPVRMAYLGGGIVVGMCGGRAGHVCPVHSSQLKECMGGLDGMFAFRWWVGSHWPGPGAIVATSVKLAHFSFRASFVFATLMNMAIIGVATWLPFPWWPPWPVTNPSGSNWGHDKVAWNRATERLRLAWPKSFCQCSFARHQQSNGFLTSQTHTGYGWRAHEGTWHRP